MAKRKDGKKTRHLLLESACEEFARRGYQNATISDICKRAGANIASVNYYFGDKSSLYVEAWLYAHSVCRQTYPLETVAESVQGAPPEVKLHAHIESLLKIFTSEDEQLGVFHQMHLRELTNPTGLVDELWREMKEPFRSRMQAILRELTGPAARDEELMLSEICVINLCRGLLPFNRRDMGLLNDRRFTPEFIAKLADFITRFALDGLRAVGDERM